MPGPGIHLLVLDETIAALKKSKKKNRDMAQIMENNLDFASLGAIGPDLMNFIGFGPKLIRPISKSLGFIREVQSLFDEISKLSTKATMPNLGSRIKQIGDTIDLLTARMESEFLDYLFDIVSIFQTELFKNSNIQKNEPEEKWSWADILHSRLSYKMSSQLLSAAFKANQSAQSQWHAYALGYLTHLATDITGHPYVNQVTGGPARSFATRHHLAENFMDSKAWLDMRGQEIAGAQLHRRIEGVDTSKLLKPFSAMVSNCLLQFYADSTKVPPGLPYRLPQEPKGSDIEDAYYAFKAILELITSITYIAPPTFPNITIPPLPGGVGSWTQSVVQSFFPPSIKSLSILDILIAIALSAVALLVFAADLVRFIFDISLGTVTYPSSAAIWLLQMDIYNVYRTLLEALTISGVTYPFKDELTNQLGIQFCTSLIPDKSYPHQEEQVNYIQKVIIPMIGKGVKLTNIALLYYYYNYPSTPQEETYYNYPSTPQEETSILSSPYANESPSYFINKAARDSGYLKAWIQSINGSPKQLDELNKIIQDEILKDPNHVSKKALGNAVEMAVKFIEEPYPFNLSLDADRGYGYRIWTFKGGLPIKIINPRWT